MAGSATAVLTLIGVALGGVINILGSVAIEQRRESSARRREREAVVHELQDVCEEIVAHALVRGGPANLPLWEYRPEALEELESTEHIDRLMLTATKLAARAEHREVEALTRDFLGEVDRWSPLMDSNSDLTTSYRHLVDGITLASRLG